MTVKKPRRARWRALGGRRRDGRPVQILFIILLCSKVKWLCIYCKNKQLIYSNIMSFAVSCSYLQLAAVSCRRNKPCKIDGQGWLKPIIYWVTWQWKHHGERAGARSAGSRDYWEHCASILAILKSYKKKNKKLVKKKLFIYANLVMHTLEFGLVCFSYHRYLF